MTPPRAPVLPALLVLSALSAGLSGCAFSDGSVRHLARTGVQGAVLGAGDSEAALRRTLRDVLLQDDMLEQIAIRMARGGVTFLSQKEQKDHVARLVADLTDTLRKNGDEVMGHFLKLIGDQLEQSLRTISADSLSRADATAKGLLHRDLVEVSQTIIRKNAEILSQTLADELRGRLGSSLQEAGGQLARSVVTEAALSLRDEHSQAAVRDFLRSAMREAVLGAGDGLKQELHSSPTQVALIAVTVSLGVLLVSLGLILWFFVRQYLLSSKALALIAQKINETGDDGKPLKKAIREHAERNRVEPWLSDFLKRRGL